MTTTSTPAETAEDEDVEFTAGDPAGYELDGVPQNVLDCIGALDHDTASGCG